MQSKEQRDMPKIENESKLNKMGENEKDTESERLKSFIIRLP